MKLAQNQVWKTDDEYLRIVVLKRLSVNYKIVPTAPGEVGKHRQASKKEFCRLLKGARLVAPDELRAIESGEVVQAEVPMEKRTQDE